MRSFFKKRLNLYFLFIFIFIFFNNPTLSALKTIVTEVNNDVFVLDVYGKRFNLKNSAKIKTGDFLKTNSLPASFILNNKTKVCLSANSSLKITTLDLIKESYEITFQFRSGNLYISIPINSDDTHNINFFNYSIKNSKNDFVLSKSSKLELTNYRNSFTLFFKDKKIKKIPPLTYLKLSKGGNSVHSSITINSNDIKNRFLVGCINKISKDKHKNNSKALQYGCITQSGKLVCGNRHK